MPSAAAAYLVSKAIRSFPRRRFRRPSAWRRSYEFEVQDMPVTVAVDANGTSVHENRSPRVATAHRPDSADGGMKLFRRRAAPLARNPTASLLCPGADGSPDEAQPADSGHLPPHRTTGYYVWQQWRRRDERSPAARRDALAMWPNCRSSASTPTTGVPRSILESLSTEGDIAYAVIIDRKGESSLPHRRKSLGRRPPRRTRATPVRPPGALRRWRERDDLALASMMTA